MKRILMILACCVVLCGCGGKSEKLELPSSKELLEQLQEKNSNLSEIEEFTSETDPNGKLGKPGYYISKADFSDVRVEQVGEYLCGGTIETFSSEKDCESRADYLNGLNDPDLGAFGLNQYVYQYDCVLFRVSYDLTPEQAEEYHVQMDEIMNQYEDVPEREENESQTNSEPEIINGCERADYDKYNSPASENGLDGTKIFLDGIAYECEESDGVLWLIIQQSDEKKWLVGFSDEPEKDKDMMDDIVGKSVRVFGKYLGYSDAYEMPAFSVQDEKGCIQEDQNGEWIDIWTFSDGWISSNAESKTIDTLSFVYSDNCSINIDYFINGDSGKKQVGIFIKYDDEGYGFALLSYLSTVIELAGVDNSVDFLISMSDGEENYGTIRSEGNTKTIKEPDMENVETTDEHTEKSLEYYDQLIEFLGKNDLKDNSGDAETDSGNKEIVNQLKELYKEDSAKKIEYSEKNSNSCFEVVLKSSKELAKSTAGLSAEEMVNNVLFNPFAVAAGYLCNYHESDTDYGKVGNMAFELIGAIASGNSKETDRILGEFDKIANDYGMEIKTIDESKEQEAGGQSQTRETEPIELSTGKYIVGEDIPAGKYDIIGVSKGNIKVCSAGKDYGDVVSEIITPDETVYANVRLENGYTVELVLGGKVRLQPK